MAAATSLFDELIYELGYENGLVKSVSIDQIKAKPIKRNLAKHTFDLIKEIDAIYFSGEHPLIYFKNLQDIDEQTIRNLHKKIWNQGRVPLMFVSTPHEIRIYNCYNEPIRENENNLNRLEIDRFADAINQFEEIKNIYAQDKLDSGLFWETFSGKKIQTSQKVDQLLLSNLRETRKQLHSLLPGKSSSLSIIHNILSRSLFILYLEDRKVLTPNYYNELLNNATSYFDILLSKDATYTLFNSLNDKFNGDLFAVTKSEEQFISLEHLNLIRNCFYGNTDIRNRQMLLWRVFDFSYIPIELISAIYEEFLHTEEGENEISSQGAYYTPHPLVEFVLNEVLPYPDENNNNYDIKILDPACGSGIFLVEAYGRLIQRWKYVNKEQRISVEILRNILQNSIFGIEKNKEAIKVASFSLYLTMLNYLEPKSIWTKVRFPLLINSVDKSADKQGMNLIQADTFDADNHFDIDFTLVIGNPPWKRGNLSGPIIDYIKRHSLAKEAVLAFLHKMAHIAPNAKIALVSAAKILFNSTSGYENFRKFLFNDTRVDCIVNFSALRKSKGEIGRKLFSSATGPTIVVFYHGTNIKTKSDSIIYCAPKPQVRDTALSELMIDASDIKFVSTAEASNPKSNVWKVAMWGTMRDIKLLKKVGKADSLLNILETENGRTWTHGGGFRTTGPKKFNNTTLKRLPYLPAGQIERYYTTKDKSIRINDAEFERLGAIKTYKAPHIVIKEGQTNKRFCASYLDYDCIFKSNTYGIVGNVDVDVLKSITAYLNSKFATYYLFLSLSSWGIERERVEFNQMLSIPAFDFLFDNTYNKKIAEAVDRIISVKQQLALHEEQQIKEIENEIDELIFAGIGITKDERTLIDNAVEYSLDFFQEGAKSKAILPLQLKDLEKYAKRTCNNLKKVLNGAYTNFWAKTYPVSPLAPLSIISIHFNNLNETGTVVNDNQDTDAIIRRLNRSIFKRHSESIYFRKIVKYYDNDVLFIVKPNEKRFWTEAIALEDSDSIAIEMITADK